MPHTIRTPKAPATDAQRALIRLLANGQGTDRHQPRIVPLKAASKARRIAGQPTTCKKRADEVIRGLLTYPTAAPKVQRERKQRQPKRNDQPKAGVYRIEVLKARGWAVRTTVEATCADKALTGYGIRGIKVASNVREASSGKRFRALRAS